MMTMENTNDTKKPLPNGWRRVKLNELCHLITDGTHKTPTYVEDGVRFISISNLRPFAPLDWDAYVKFITPEEHAELTKRADPQKDDILVTKIGTLGVAKRVDFDEKVSIFVGLALLKLKKDLAFPPYIEAFLNSPEAKEQAIHEAQGGGRQTLPLQSLCQFNVPLPPLSEQRRIAGVLCEQMTAVDKARAAAQTRLAAVTDLPAAFLRQVFPQPDEPLPHDWHWVRLREVCSFKRGPFGGSLKKEIFTESGYRVYEQQHAIKNDFEIGSYYINEEKFREMEAFSLQPGDLIISCSGTMGRVAVSPSNMKPGIINQALLKLTPMLNQIRPEYLKLCLESETIQIRYFRVTAGAAIQNVASVSQLKEIPVPLPPIPVQQKIACVFCDQVASVEKARLAAEAELQTINALPAALLRRAFNGEAQYAPWEEKQY